MTPTHDVGVAAIVRRLSAAGCVRAQDEASELIAAAMDATTLDRWVTRRERGEPLAWITGTTRFCGHAISIDPHVFVPRRQSEELAHRASERLPRTGRAVDLCTGAGAIAVHLRAGSPDATVIGTDVDERAVRCARRNGVTAVVCDLGGSLRSRAFDVVTAVAPYVPTAALALLPVDVQAFEPRRALDGGIDGLTQVRRTAQEAARLLRAGGWFLTELGGDQAGALEPMLTSLGFDEITPWFDDDGDLRGLAGRRTG